MEVIFMIKKRMNLNSILVLFALCLFAVEAKETEEGMFKNTQKSRLILGFHLHFDPNRLGAPIVKDGLEAGSAKTDAQGNYAGSQLALIPDNRLLVLKNVTGGAFQVYPGGAMTAGGMTLGYEKDVGDNFFYRIGLNLTTKIMGGHTVSTFAGYKWYDIYWNYRSATIPVYFGLKLNLGSRLSFYVAPGLTYFRAMWQIKGYNDGDALDAMTGGSLSRLLPAASDALRPGMIQEDAVFSASGFGLGYLIGTQSKITNSGFVFFELETLFAYAMATAKGKSFGGIRALSPYPVYPVSVSGDYLRIGYKHEL